MNKDLIAYKTSSALTSETLSDALRQTHNAQQDIWTKLHIQEGHLDLAISNTIDNTTDTQHFSVTKQPPLITPQQTPYIINVSDNFQCQLTSYCQKKDYCTIKYNLTATHSDVITAADNIPKGKVLDLGCGSGRNALYLNKLGFDVTAVDKNEPNITAINHIISQEYLSKFQARIYDINQADLTGNYDFVLSTVVMMFLQPARIPDIIHNMQSITKSGGYNLIVSAMSTSDYPCSMPFSFTFKENELLNYYQGWHIIQYNENVGTLHKTDINGNRIQLRFATLHATKN